MHEAAVPAADQHFGIAGHGRVYCVARHVPAIDAVRRRRRHASDGVARVDIFKRDFALGLPVMFCDAAAQVHADILELCIATLVSRAVSGIVAHQLLCRAFGDHYYRVTLARQHTIEVGKYAALAFQHRIDFRDQHQVNIGGRQRGLASDEPGMAAHEFDKADAIARTHRLDPRAAHHIHRGGIRTFEAEAAIDEMDIVVDGLRYADHRDFEAAPFDLCRELHCAADGAIATDDKKNVYAVGLKIIDNFTGVLRAARRAENSAALMMNMRHRFRGEHHRIMAEPRNQPFVAEAEPQDAFHAIPASKFEHKPAHDVVDAGAKSAASDDTAADGARIEKNLVARSREFKSGHVANAGNIVVHDRHAIID